MHTALIFPSVHVVGTPETDPLRTALRFHHLFRRDGSFVFRRAVAGQDQSQGLEVVAAGSERLVASADGFQQTAHRSGEGVGKPFLLKLGAQPALRLSHLFGCLNRDLLRTAGTEYKIRHAYCAMRQPRRAERRRRDLALHGSPKVSRLDGK